MRSSIAREEDQPADQTTAQATVASGQDDATTTWGAMALRRLPPGALRALEVARAVWRRVAPYAPMVAVGVMLLLMARAYFVLQRYYTKPGYEAIAAFADIGTISGHHLGLNDLVMNNNPVGFDGQFFYFIALDPSQPIICAQQHPHPANCALDDAFGEVRAERILYPYTAGLLTFGQADLVPYTLLLVNFAAILLVVWLVGKMCVEAGASIWLGAAAGLFCGQVLGFLRDLADPFSVMWVVLAIYLLRKERYLWSSLAIAAALLTREQFILTIPLLFVPLLAQRKWRTLALSLLIGLGPFVAWQIYLRIIWGKWALLTGDTQGAGVGNGINPIPFHGLWDERLKPEFGLIVAFVVVPLVLAVVISLMQIWRNGPRHLLLDPVPALIILYVAMLSLTSWILWQDMWTPGRLADLAVVLGVIVVSRLPFPALRASYGTLLSITSMAAMILVLR